MKTKKFKFKQILTLHLLKSRAYEYAFKKANSHFITESNLTHSILAFKKALHIIFEYHQAGKRILFIGVPSKLELKINRSTDHIAVPSYFDLQGIFSKSFKPAKLPRLGARALSKMSTITTLFPKMSKKPDLIVLVSHEKKKNIIVESNAAKVPVVLFDSDFQSQNSNLHNVYFVPGIGKGLVGVSNKNLFLFGFSFLFKRFTQKVGKSISIPSFSRVKKQFK